MKDKSSLVEWAGEVARKVKGNENMSVPVILSEVCKEIVISGDVDKAKVIVANRILNGN